MNPFQCCCSWYILVVYVLFPTYVHMFVFLWVESEKPCDAPLWHLIWVHLESLCHLWTLCCWKFWWRQQIDKYQSVIFCKSLIIIMDIKGPSTNPLKDSGCHRFPVWFVSVNNHFLLSATKKAQRCGMFSACWLTSYVATCGMLFDNPCMYSQYFLLYSFTYFLKKSQMYTVQTWGFLNLLVMLPNFKSLALFNDKKHFKIDRSTILLYKY